MKILLFYHSLISDWNHGNAHFLRGIASELVHRGHQVEVFEPRDGWSYRNWFKENGTQGIKAFNDHYPRLHTNFYEDVTDFEPALRDADLVIAHEWNDPDLVKQLGDLKGRHHYRLLFHDTHHRSVTAPEEIAKYDLSSYDGALAYGRVIRDLYLQNGWTGRAWTWQEAADTRVFHPIEEAEEEGDVIWIGNWGDDERAAALREFLINPVKEMGLKAKVYGVRYPEKALTLLDEAGIEYGGYLPSYRAPEAYARYKCTIHVPRKAYAKSLPGIPTIRPFEALACGIPLISAPWQDSENLFRINSDFLMVQNGEEMIQALDEVLHNEDRADSLTGHGLETIRNRHTCAHRVDELMNIYDEIEITNYKATERLKQKV
jgi:spore maturation protein CgeB